MSKKWRIKSGSVFCSNFKWASQAEKKTGKKPLCVVAVVFCRSSLFHPQLRAAKSRPVTSDKALSKVGRRRQEDGRFVKYDATTV